MNIIETMKKEQKQLRSGFTTGTCAAAAASAAAFFLGGEEREKVSVFTPAGIVAVFSVRKLQKERMTWFGVQKDAGDDPDVTHGSWIYASVKALSEEELTDSSGQIKRSYIWEEDTHEEGGKRRLFLTAADGVGLVTKPGLSCPVGKYAINPVPREMIFHSVQAALEEMEIYGDFLIQIWIPQGKELAEKTFNPKLGITGGISILGTTGVVNPMSEQALMDTIRLEIHIKAVAGEKIVILTPGNYGEQFLADHIGIALKQAVVCSNFVSDAIQWCAAEGIEKILFVGHIGKLIKVAGGVKNTHSKYGDRRMEILADCLPIGISSEQRTHILACNTTEEAMEYLSEWNIRKTVLDEAVRRMKDYMNRWAGNHTDVEVVTFSTVYGILGKSENSSRLIEEWRQKHS